MYQQFQGTFTLLLFSIFIILQTLKYGNLRLESRNVK